MNGLLTGHGSGSGKGPPLCMDEGGGLGVDLVH